MLTNRLQYLFVALMMAAPVCCFAQLNLTAESPIWGTLGSGNRTASPLHHDPNWGVLPSQQTLNVTSNENSFLRRKKEPNRRVNRNVRGEPILLDLQGNIVYDVYGNTVVDSIALGNQDGSFGSMGYVNSIAPPPPPGDPIDVPIDGGVEILLMIGLGIGYKTKKPVLQKNMEASNNGCL